MIRPTRQMKRSINVLTQPVASSLDGVRNRMAQALVGQAVSLLVAPEIITKGVVTDVLAEADAPKIVVHGLKYNFNQILTSIPASFCC